jgi:hypothetical protein
VEHRWGERLSVRARVALRVQGGLRGIGYIRDISISGALLVTGVRAPLMSSVRVSVPDNNSTSTVIEGLVVRHTDDGFAVEWCELAPEGVQSIAHPAPAAPERIVAEIVEVTRGVSAAR